RGERMPSPLDQLREVVEAVSVPVQAVGGLTLEQAIQCPAYGAPLVVLGAPLTIDADAFKTAGGDLESSLRLICEKIHAGCAGSGLGLPRRPPWNGRRAPQYFQRSEKTVGFVHGIPVNLRVFLVEKRM